VNKPVRWVVLTTDWDTLVTNAFCNPIEKSRADDNRIENLAYSFGSKNAEKLTANNMIISRNMGII